MLYWDDGEYWVLHNGVATPTYLTQEREGGYDGQLYMHSKELKKDFQDYTSGGSERRPIFKTREELLEHYNTPTGQSIADAEFAIFELMNPTARNLKLAQLGEKIEKLRTKLII